MKKYLTKEVAKELVSYLPPLKSQIGTNPNPVVHVHLVYPRQRQHWWIMEGQALKDDYVFSMAINDVYGYLEFIQFTLKQTFEDCTEPDKIEVDTEWVPKTIQEVRDGGVEEVDIEFECTTVENTEDGYGSILILKRKPYLPDSDISCAKDMDSVLFETNNITAENEEDTKMKLKDREAYMEKNFKELPGGGCSISADALFNYLIPKIEKQEQEHNKEMMETKWINTHL